MADSELKRILDTEYKEWLAQVIVIVRERDGEIKALRDKAATCSDPEGALISWSRPLKLQALRRAVDVRLQLREEYGQHEPELLSQDCLSKLRSSVEQFINGESEGDRRSLAECGNILAHARAQIDKLSLKAKWWQMPNDARNVYVTLNNSAGAVVTIDSVVGQIQANAHSIAEAGNPQLAEAIIALTNAVKQSFDLGEGRAEMLQNIEVLGKEAAKPTQERAMGVVKSLYLGLAGGLKGANDMATAWDQYGSAIARHLGLQ